MVGIKNKRQILQLLNPKLSETKFVFCTFSKSNYGDLTHLEPLGSYQEKEGLTLIIPKGKADEYNIQYESCYRVITLSVHSSLDSTGLTAVISSKLAERDISANMIAAYFHDYIFVPSAQADLALNVLLELQNEYSTDTQNHE
jgi:hypothetical protein